MEIQTVRNRSVHALNRTKIRLEAAIRQRDSSTNHGIPSDVEFALRRFFNSRATTFLDILLRRVQLITRVVPEVRVRRISRSYLAATSDNNSERHFGNMQLHTPAAAFPNEHYIALYSPYWEEKGQYQPGVLIHECFHYYFGHMRGHPRDNRRINAFAYQGLVCHLGRLPIGPGVRTNLGY
ncbi:hypothetical protein [Aquimarina sp. MMG016]|uniref:hypothetical protein n=1 Tax=Aquimarina sp. MMG016 TaxID=2822690 RepID=UPI001B39F220|nr:hypothetical protein [Aquimarina sp. MMG016]MBQ4818867.1 hypothetical protein [Aquimarina sp. MMG016]